MPKKGKKGHKNNSSTEPKQLIEKEDDQEYARVTKVLGGSRYLLSMNMTNKEVIGKLRGTMRRRKKANWVGPDSVVLVCMRDFQTQSDEKSEWVDIVHVYSDQEVRILKKNKEFIEDVKTNRVHKEDQPAEEEEDEDIGFDFDDI